MDYNQISIEGDASQDADRVKIVYYTDPLCCWSWALEPHWQRFVTEKKGLITYSYCMGGMIPDWQKFNDPLNAVDRPVQMGPVWMEAKHLTGIMIDESIWVLDPPSSSYPGCIAVKAAGLQSKLAEELLLKRIREAVMLERKNIARVEVLADLAKETSERFPEVFDYQRFITDFNSGPGRQAFRDDMAKTRYHQIGRFPSITMTEPSGTSLIITGYRPYQVLADALTAVSKKADCTSSS